MAKGLTTTYLGITLSSQGINEKRNITRGNGNRQDHINSCSGKSNSKRTARESEIIIRNVRQDLSFLYNAMLLPDLRKLEDIGNYVYRNLLKSVVMCRKSLDNKKLALLRALYQITPLLRKVEKDVVRFIKKLRRVAEE